MSISTNLMFNKILLGLLATVAPAACAYPLISQIENPPAVDVSVNEEKALPIEVVEKTWKCPGCNDNEKYVLKQLQEKTNISDRNALATILGNIKSESNFHANICEGGARVSYNQCHSGGYGLIQWTTANRYNGLGKFCRKYNCDPSSIEGQTRYMINENQFQKYITEFQGRGFGIHQYMVPSYYWLGWGIKGARETYAYNYVKRFVLS